jgi:hypothetical protein
MEINARYRQRFVAEFGAYISIKEYETELSQFRVRQSIDLLNKRLTHLLGIFVVA